MAYAIGSAPGGMIRFSDGTIHFPQSSATNPAAANYQPSTSYQSVNKPANTPYTNPPQQPSGGQAPGDSIVTDDFNKKPGDGWGWSGDHWVDDRQQPTPTPNDAEMQQVDSAYNSAMEFLGRAEEAIRGFQPTVEAGINATVDTNKQLADTQKAQGERGIATAQTDTQSRLQNAITAARQALQESMMGGKQRFGSASNITKALGEYGTTKFQQASGQARDIAEQTYRSLAEQTQQLTESYGNAIAQLNQWKTTQMQLAKQEFMNKLMEIDSNRNEAAQNKSFQKIQLLSDMRNRADAIKTQAWTFAQNLEAQRQAYAQQIGASINSYGQKAVSGANKAATTGSNLISSVNMNPISATSGVTSSPTTMTGQIAQKRYDEFGNPIS